MPTNPDLIRREFRGKTKLFDYSGGLLPVYVGEAESGSTTDDERWSIFKLAYDVNGNIVSRKWANGSEEAIFIWNNRASYTYS